MNEDGLVAVRIPKWGLSMEEGTVRDWHVAEGATVAEGDELVDIETSKIANVLEARASGILARIMAEPGETLECGSVIAVIAQGEVDDEAVNRFLADAERGDGAEEDLAKAGGTERKTIQLSDDISISYIEEGKGARTIVLLHGFGGDALNWMYVQPLLSEKAHTISVDLPGHGESTKRLEKAALSDFVDVFAVFLESLEIERAEIVGHSFGGSVALAFAGAYPDRVSRLTLVAPALAETLPAPAYTDGFLAARRARDMRATLGRLFADPELVTGDMVEGLIRFKRIDGVERTLNGIAHILTDPAQLPRIRTAPEGTRFVWGSEDQIVAMPSAVAGLTQPPIIIGEAGHMPHLEAPKAVSRAILADD